MELISGMLGQDIVIVLDIAPGGTAMSMSCMHNTTARSLYSHCMCYLCTIPDESDFVIGGDQFLTFGPDVRPHLVAIDVVDDDVFEAMSENFLVSLITDATELHGLRLGTANLTIKDNDRNSH